MSKMKSIMAYWADGHKLRDGKSWSQWCGSLMVRFNGLSIAYPKAIDAWRASKIESTDPRKAPVGAFHYWAWGRSGHVGQDASGGGTRVFMASNYCSSYMGAGLGWASVAGWASRAAAAGIGAPRYLGWSKNYGANRTVRKADDLGDVPHSDDPKPPVNPTPVTPAGGTKTLTKADVRRIARYLNKRLSGRNTIAAHSGIRTKGYWKLLQRAGRHDHLYGKGYVVNGVPGPKTRALEAHYNSKAK